MLDLNLNNCNNNLIKISNIRPTKTFPTYKIINLNKITNKSSQRIIPNINNIRTLSLISRVIKIIRIKASKLIAKFIITINIRINIKIRFHQILSSIQLKVMCTKITLNPINNIIRIILAIINKVIEVPIINKSSTVVKCSIITMLNLR